MLGDAAPPTVVGLLLDATGAAVVLTPVADVVDVDALATVDAGCWLVDDPESLELLHAAAARHNASTMGATFLDRAFMTFPPRCPTEQCAPQIDSDMNVS